MARQSWVQINGQLIPKEELNAYQENRHAFPMVAGDLPDFVSPIDGTLVSGRAGLRDHCARHNVTPMADLAGLPMRTMHTDYQPTREERQQTKRLMADIIDSRGY